MIGHSVALNFYNKKADRMLEDFRVLNNSVQGSGVFTEMVRAAFSESRRLGWLVQLLGCV